MSTNLALFPFPGAGISMSIRHSGERIRLYRNVMYKWASFMHYVPLQYEVSGNSARAKIRIANSRASTIFGLASFLTLVTYVIYSNILLLLGHFDQFQAWIIMGFTCIFVILLMAQVWILFPSTLHDGISIINSMLQDYSAEMELQDPSLSHELMCLFTAYNTVVYPFLYYPGAFILAKYMPALAFPLHRGSGLIAARIFSGNEGMSNVLELGFIYGYFACIATALGHGLVNAMLVCHWISSYLFTTSIRLERLQRERMRTQNRNLDAEREYMRISVSFRAFREAFSLVMSVSVFALGTATIILNFIILQPVPLPPFFVVAIIIADVGIVLILFSSLVLITNCHLLSNSLVGSGRRGLPGASKPDLKFWAGMARLKVRFGGVAECETREFLLRIWFDVILQSVIDLLLTF